MTWTKPCFSETGWQCFLGACCARLVAHRMCSPLPAMAEVAAFVGVETVIAGKVAASQNGQVIVAADGLSWKRWENLYRNPGAVIACARRISPYPYQKRASRSSARNQLTGRIMRMTPSGPLVRVVVDCGLPVVALITRGSANEMKLDGRSAGDCQRLKPQLCI